MSVIRQLIALHEGMPIFKVLEQEGAGSLATMLAAIAGELPEVEGEEPGIIERADGSLLIDGMLSTPDAFERLGLRELPEGDYHGRELRPGATRPPTGTRRILCIRRTPN